MRRGEVGKRGQRWNVSYAKGSIFQRSSLSLHSRAVVEGLHAPQDRLAKERSSKAGRGQLLSLRRMCRRKGTVCSIASKPLETESLGGQESGWTDQVGRWL
eukprot:2234171-Pleurochrysis_carterae.AAC.1